MSEYKHSIADLQRCEREMLPAPWDVGDDASDGEVVDRELHKQIATIGRAPVADNTAGIAVLRNAAPVLLEIAAAALALRQAGIDGDEVIRLMNAATSADEYSAACTLAPRVDEKRRAALRSLDAALAKVRP